MKGGMLLNVIEMESAGREGNREMGTKVRGWARKRGDGIYEEGRWCMPWLLTTCRVVKALDC